MMKGVALEKRGIVMNAKKSPLFQNISWCVNYGNKIFFGYSDYLRRKLS